LVAVGAAIPGVPLRDEKRIGGPVAIDLLASVTDQYAPDYDVAAVFERRSRRAEEQPFTSPQGRDAWAAPIPPDGPNMRRARHFYLHVPFCNQVCRFCCYFVVAKTSEDRVEGYLDWLKGGLYYFAETFAAAPFQTLYVGGGTPSVLTAEQTDRLLSALFDR